MIDRNFLNYIESQGFSFKSDEPMNLHTSFRIGGCADCFCEVKSNDELRKIILACREYQVPYYVIGLGSNILVSDGGFRGIILKLDGEFGEIKMEDDLTVRCGAGVSLAKLCSFAAKSSLGGLEFAWGIPGSVGGAVYMNAGAYEGEIKNVVSSTSYISPEGNMGFLEGKENDFSYRHSYYSDKPLIITEVRFKLHTRPSAEIYADMQEKMESRKLKQPLNKPSAGSTFKRPKGYYAAKLIDECGLKGCSVGDAQVSEKHSGFIVNMGNATASDVKELIKYVQKVVFEKKGVKLSPEIKFIGQ